MNRARGSLTRRGTFPRAPDMGTWSARTPERFIIPAKATRSLNYAAFSLTVQQGLPTAAGSCAGDPADRAMGRSAERQSRARGAARQVRRWGRGEPGPWAWNQRSAVAEGCFFRSRRTARWRRQAIVQGRETGFAPEDVRGSRAAAGRRQSNIVPSTLPLVLRRAVSRAQGCVASHSTSSLSSPCFLQSSSSGFRSSCEASSPSATS